MSDPPIRHLFVPVLLAMLALGFFLYNERMAGIVTGICAFMLWLGIGVGHVIRMSRDA